MRSASSFHVRFPASVEEEEEEEQKEEEEEEEEKRSDRFSAE